MRLFVKDMLFPEVGFNKQGLNFIRNYLRYNASEGSLATTCMFSDTRSIAAYIWNINFFLFPIPYSVLYGLSIAQLPYSFL